MGKIQPFSIGERVTRKSYNHDVLFRVASVKQEYAFLHGEDIRLIADAPMSDLQIIEERELKKRQEREKEKEEYSYRLFRQDYQLMKEKRDYISSNGYNYENFFQIPPRVLHLDGDVSYLKKCIKYYERIGLQVHGVHVPEKDMPFQIGDLVKKIQPNIIIITGHDSFSKQKGEKHELRAYRNSKHFVEAVREARKIIPSLDQLVIFAGACQSHFELLIRAGANFASSPSRINIHALDPVYIVAKIAYTSFMEKVNVWEVLRNTLTGEKGIGGIETRGMHRTGMPYLNDEDIAEM
ncbi:sporulation peptidase YabG [Cerasibacillus terrae]|uniref:Sporulation peptidase YabG n=1 Tax=Cerasibacillus terrae TaxID=2498845 RepID=A0A5C8NQL8_9BACI|nr:sporulation peptidase YabG [Cerasibacillus terrae]TXL63436.1 sporulation peptidase YabG [Cerasibacillus terrae]